MLEDLDPIQLDNDELACPNCISALIEGKSAFYFKKYKVGVFDSLKCEFCGYYVLTEKGFIESSKKMKDLALTERDIVEEETESSGIIIIEFPKAFLTENIVNAINLTEQKKELEPISTTMEINTGRNTLSLLQHPKLKFEMK